ncbi:peptidoglycan-recognition protein SC2-like isoform X2 [Mercenaria mercenaria]|uniref:peptidoglycan-recognition protein SC2-like isoform X2 n=1 Tax=Mercenaria mercenaria TaxID=6596 RepID=UPI00234F66F8|nr:peptidoglycan-recognition protein SC2-like isoform X2 [Mercenaria mercenaria]
MGDTNTENCLNGVENSQPLTNFDVTIVTRNEWGARPSKEINYMGTPVSVVFIHHTSMNECHTQDQCMEEMKKIQNFHMDDRGWDDIAYNYLIGEDGRVYEGRAWDRIGAHTLKWNDVAVAFSFMGNYCSKLPNDKALHALKAMLALGVKNGKITPDYKLYGHRNVGETECPGDKLHELISSWSHFDNSNSTPVKPEPKPYISEDKQ